MTDHFDVVVAGGGVAGALTAARIAHFHPDLAIALVEKDPQIGGRLGTSSDDKKSYFSGFSGVSPVLYEFLDQSLKMNPEAPDLPEFYQEKIKTFGVVAAGKVKTAPLEEFVTKRSARFLGGLAAQREWEVFAELLERQPEEGEKQPPFGQIWDKPRKHPSSVALENIAAVMGIPDLWNCDLEAIKDRARCFQKGMINARWQEVLGKILEGDSDGGEAPVTVLTDCMIVGAKYHQSAGWEISTEAGPITSKALVVAMAPWSATWLHRDHWPTTVHPLITKSKPVSAVTLTTRLKGLHLPEDDEGEKSERYELPDLTLIPSESSQAYRFGNELCIQTTVDYEVTLQAPAVVKGIKRLRRALKKLKATIDLDFEGEHLALMPVAWAQSPLQSDRRLRMALSKDKHNSAHLAFAGDAYGTSCDSDQNTVDSLLKAFAAVTANLPGPSETESEVAAIPVTPPTAGEVTQQP